MLSCVFARPGQVGRLEPEKVNCSQGSFDSTLTPKMKHFIVFTDHLFA